MAAEATVSAKHTQHVIHEFFKAVGREISVQDKTVIIQAGELPDRVFYLEKGRVKAYSTDKSGNLHLHVIFTPGKCFPIMRALRSKTNQISCVAHGSVALRVVSLSDFLRQIDEDASFAKALLHETAGQFAIFTNRIENLQYSSARERLIYRLLTLAGSIGDKQPNDVAIITGLTHEDLAASIQVSREVVTRLLRALQKKEILTSSRQQISIDPSKALAELHDSSLTLEEFDLRS